MKTEMWKTIESVSGIVAGIATVIGLVAGLKNNEDTEDQIRRIIKEEKEKEIKNA